MRQLIECIPNFSEGRNRKVIDQIVHAIADTSVHEEKVKVLNIDPGEATNRTVVTFVGSPEVVCEAAFQGAKKAAEVIDMRKHQGTHPRSGATDVLPLVPISGISLEECAEMARGLAERLYRELGIPCYCYEASAFRPDRKNLAVCRSGEYESLKEKIEDPERRPDFGPDHMTPMVEQAGATNIGARNFLIAVNFNLNTTSTREAMEIARDVRESGRIDQNGVRVKGSLKGCKAIGWYIEEYGIAQVSMNITDILATPLHIAFEEVRRCAQKRGLQVTGTEIIGLVPLSVLVQAGRYYWDRQHDSQTGSQEELIQLAIQSMGLNDLKPFRPEDKVLEFLYAEI